MADHLPGIKCTNKKVVLHIISAYGFSLVKGSILIQATFMNKTLKTIPIPVNNNELKCNASYIWYMDNATLRKLKMSNASIKIECFHIPTNESNVTTRLGYILLKIKEAQIINQLCYERIDTRWHKLIGSKNCSYSLKTSLRIENFNFNDFEEELIKIKPRKSINNENATSKDQNVLKEEEKKDFEENIETDLSKNNFDVLDHIKKLTDADINKLKNIFNLDVRQKSIELYEWENKQKNLFYEKMKNKEKQLLKEFNKKWSDDRKIIEKELAHEISKCKALTKSMDEIVDMLKDKESIIAAKELESFNNTPTINELNQKIIDLETKLHELEKNNVLLNIQNKQISNINIDCGTRIRQLEKTVLDLENKYQEANESSMFFKEKWIICVRKINQINDKLHQNKSSDCTNNKQHIKNILSNCLAEQTHDQEKFKKLLSELK